MLNTGCDALAEGQAAGFPERREETKFIKPKDVTLIEQRVLLGKLTFTHVIRIFHSIYMIRYFMTLFTPLSHWSFY
jgi:hypothetical protein